MPFAVAYSHLRRAAFWRPATAQSYTGIMKIIRAALVAITCSAATLALAQWQWVDPGGRKVFSDQAPPPGTPPEKILRQPGSRPVDTEPAAAAAPAAAPVPKVSGQDRELEEKRKAAAAADDEKKRAQEERVARERADSCDRARRAKATLDSGIRLSQVNANGEREILDDDARATESKRLETVIARDCKG